MCQESLINYLYNAVNTQKLTPSEAKQDVLFAKKKVKQTDLKLEKFEEIVSKEDISTFIKLGESTYTNSNRGINEDLPSSIKENAVKINQALKDVKICDPAIGSGAFPVGMMNEIVRARLALGVENKSAYQIKREIIENNLYGVDLDDGAVEIAKLRFWLSLIVDEEDISNIKPLPNLDYKVMQGNSLISTYEGINFDEIVEDYKPKNVQLDFDYFGSKSDNIITNINNLMYRYIKVSHDTEKQEIRDKIEQEIVNLVKSKVEEKAKQGGIQWDQAEQTIRDFAQNNKHRNFFPWKLFFADVFMNGGFDIVIGNPPYIDSETMVKTLSKEREQYANIYKSAKGNWDIFVIFCEKSLLIGKNGSINSFIIPNKFLAAKYSEEIRRICSEKNFIEVRDYSRINVFEEASVYPIVYVLNNSSNKNKYVCMCKMNEDFNIVSKNIIKSEVFYRDILWDKYFQDDVSVNILIKVSDNRMLSEHNDIAISAAATVNEAYKVKEVLRDCEKYDARDYIRFINSGTIDKYQSLWGIKKMQYIKGSYKNPVIYSSDVKNINPNRLKQAYSSKIIIANMTKEIEAFYDEGKYLAAKSTTIICGEGKKLKYLIALLNSHLITYWYQINYNSLKMQGEALGFGSNEIGTIPIAQADTETKEILIELVESIISLTSANNNDSYVNNLITEYKDKIDITVYKLYGLTYSEVLTVDKDFKLSEKEYNEYKLN